jgi:Xaa-Pro aminopeptidase
MTDSIAMDYRKRQHNMQQTMQRKRLDALLITHLPNIRYLCGFTGSAGVLVCTARGLTFFTDGRYIEQARTEVRGVRVSITGQPALSAAAGWLARTRARKVGIESEHMTVATRSALAGMLPRGAQLRETAGLVERARMIKDAFELANIRRAVRLGADLLKPALHAIRPGVKESAVAGEIEYAARRAGAEQMSFTTIVAAGARSALPHGRATAAAIPERGFVILDFGVILAGYCSDMTRTVHVGKPTAEARRIYGAVREAQQAATQAVRPGMTAGAVDRAARGVLQRAGLGRYFTHSTGHGVGLEIHEPPRLGRGQNEILQPGMVITIEPGVYLPGKGGVRIEDMVVVTEHGCEVLTPATRDLITL